MSLRVSKRYTKGKVTVSITATVVLRELDISEFEQLPEIHMYVRSPVYQAHGLTIFSVNEKNKVTKEFILETTDGEIQDCYLCFDLFCQVKNYQGKMCKMRAASATLDFYELCRHTHVSSRLTNNAFGIHKGFIHIDTGTPVGRVRFLKGEILSNTDEFSNFVAQRSRQLTSRNRGGVDNFVSRITMPFYITRASNKMRLIGETFFLDNGPLDAPVEWYHSLLNIAMSRVGITEGTFVATIEKQLSSNKLVQGMTDVLSVIGNFLCVYPTSMPYLSDIEYYHGNKNYGDQFETPFNRGSGDCEDLSKAILSIAKSFQIIETDRKVLRLTQTLMACYIPFACLGEVKQAGIDINTGSGRMAHMFCVLFPIPKFCRASEQFSTEEIFSVVQQNGLSPITLSYTPGWMDVLKPIILEGTGRVSPVYDPKSQGESLLDKDVRNAVVNQFTGVDLMQNISRQSPSELFYRKFCHVFTTYFIDNGVRNGDNSYYTSFSVCGTSSTRFGVSFDDVMLRDRFKLAANLPIPQHLVDRTIEILSLNHPIQQSVFLTEPVHNHVDGFIHDTMSHHSSEWIDLYGRCLSESEKKHLVTIAGRIGVRKVEQYDETLGTVRYRLFR